MTFGPGQLSGPYGPQFVGYGPKPKPSLSGALYNTALLAGVAGAIIALQVVL